MGMTDDVLISSFGFQSTIYCGCCNDIECGMLMHVNTPWGFECEFVSIFADALHPMGIYTTPDLVESIHEAGMKVNVWTVDDPSSIRCFYDMGCDGVITNTPDVCMDVLADFASQV